MDQNRTNYFSSGTNSVPLRFTIQVCLRHLHSYSPQTERSLRYLRSADRIQTGKPSAVRSPLSECVCTCEALPTTRAKMGQNRILDEVTSVTNSTQLSPSLLALT